MEQARNFLMQCGTERSSIDRIGPRFTFFGGESPGFGLGRACPVLSALPAEIGIFFLGVARVLRIAGVDLRRGAAVLRAAVLRGAVLRGAEARILRKVFGCRRLITRGSTSGNVRQQQ